MRNLKQILARVLRPVAAAVNWPLARLRPDQVCPACGIGVLERYKETLWPELVQAWELDAEWSRWINEREGKKCLVCSSSRRNRHMASAIIREIRRRTGAEGRSLSEITRDPRAATIDIAEINSCGLMSRYLDRLPRRRLSEYGSKDPSIPHEDVQRLTYADASFDLVLTSDTLEHVPDFDLALRETLRVLRPGGTHIMTVPVVRDGRPTRSRARLKSDGSLEHLLPPSFHSDSVHRDRMDFLVFSEFGDDIVERIRIAGYQLELDVAPGNPALVNYLMTRPL